MAERDGEKEPGARKSEIKTQRKSEWKKQTISTLISIPLLPRNTNNAAPKEPEANGDEAASSLTLGFSSSVLNQWQAEHTSKQTELWD